MTKVTPAPHYSFGSSAVRRCYYPNERPQWLALQWLPIILRLRAQSPRSGKLAGECCTALLLLVDHLLGLSSFSTPTASLHPTTLDTLCIESKICAQTDLPPHYIYYRPQYCSTLRLLQTHPAITSLLHPASRKCRQNSLLQPTAVVGPHS